MTQRTCAVDECNVALTKKPGPGRWPVYCDTHRAHVINTRQAHLRATRRDGSRGSCCVTNCTSGPTARGMCGKHYGRWYHTGTTDAVMQGKQCCECDVAFTIGPQQRSQKYCSPACRIVATKRISDARVYLKKPLTARPCAFCNSDFMAKRDDARFCSKVCSNNYRHTDNTRKCSIEGCERGYCANGLCKMHYRRVARAEGREKNPAWGDARRARSEIRRALKRGAPITEAIDRNAVFERDAWVCGLCASPVDRGLHYPHPMSASLDHVVPLSRGGAHVPENVQCSHLTCNLSKGARVAA